MAMFCASETAVLEWPQEIMPLIAEIAGEVPLSNPLGFLLKIFVAGVVSAAAYKSDEGHAALISDNQLVNPPIVLLRVFEQELE
jgi:hypothetical protein